jgi:DNA-binding CsgD family transcriptional regulator
MSSALTAAQAATLTAIIAFVDQHGIPPTRRDLMAALGCSHNTVTTRLDRLERLGYVELRAGTARGILVRGTELPPVGVMSPDATTDLRRTALTRREMQVLGLIAEGLSSNRIGTRLGISEHTAKFHAMRILDKLAVRTRTEAVVEAMRRGLIAVNSNTVKKGDPCATG